MNRFTNAELTVIHFIYGLADGNRRAAVRLYRERYPTKSKPNHQMFARVHQNFAENGSFTAMMQDTGRTRAARTPIFEEDLLHAVDQNLGTCLRALAAATGTSRSTVHSILQAEALYPFHLQSVQLLLPDDPPRLVAFSQWLLHQTAADTQFFSCVMFSDEATISREGVFYTHNAHMWALENPHGIRRRAAQERFSVNVWAGIVGYSLVGPYILPPRLDARKYLVFRQELLPEMLNDVPNAVRRGMWFKHDGAPAH